MAETPYNPLVQKYGDKIQQMRLLDDNFMRAVFDDNIEATELVLRIIMEKEDLKVLEVRSQFELKNIYGRSARLDVYATDDSGARYNIEIQRADQGAGERRARYNQSIIDTNHLQAGEDPKVLPEVYVIFITERDVRGGGLPIYHIERVVMETKEIFDDGEHIIYVNGAYKNEDSALGSLIADFRESDPGHVRHEALAKRMRYLKQSEEGVSHMCRIVEEIALEAAKEAKRAEFLEFIRAFAKDGLSVAKMAQYSGQSETEVLAALKELGLPVPNA